MLFDDLTRPQRTHIAEIACGGLKNKSSRILRAVFDVKKIDPNSCADASPKFYAIGMNEITKDEIILGYFIALAIGPSNYLLLFQSLLKDYEKLSGFVSCKRCTHKKANKELITIHPFISEYPYQMAFEDSPIDQFPIVINLITVAKPNKDREILCVMGSGHWEQMQKRFRQYINFVF